MAAGAPIGDGRAAHLQDDLRQRISDRLLERLDPIGADLVRIFLHSVEGLDADYCRHLGQELIRLMALSIRDGRMDAGGRFVADLRGVALARGVSVQQIFMFTYLTERTALDELALDESFGATTQSWPLVAQLARRASFDLLAAYAELAGRKRAGGFVIDDLTTLHTRTVFDAALAKEIDRAFRFGGTLSLVLFDVDHLSAINRDYGFGFGDKILERLGVLVRNYFRQYDWVARHGDDSIAVLLTQIDAGNASELAERLRRTVDERLALKGHSTDRAVAVSVSGAIVNVSVAAGTIIDAERLMADAEAAVGRAKQLGRNRLERVDGYSGTPQARPAR